jgi:SAM-dependent methyltransferase
MQAHGELAAKPGGCEVTSESRWEQEAQRWVRWARTPGHDAYWYYSPPFFDTILPRPARRTLEIGCGEGRVARDLARRGHTVVALDTSPTLVGSAKAADPAGCYLLADGAWLPFHDASFDLVVAYNSLMDVSDMPAVIAEAARVLRPSGHLCVSVTHPMSDAGSFAGKQPDAPFTIPGAYLGRRRFEGAFERDGLQMTFHSWCYPLEDYARALGDAGLLIETIREPAASEAAVREHPSFRRWQRLPMFLQLRTVKPEGHFRRGGHGRTTSS